MIINLLFLFIGVVNVAHAESLDAAQLIRNMEKQMIGESFTGTATMKVEKENDLRSLSFNVWTKSRKFALIKILEPKRDQGTGNLRIENDLWQFLPNINRVIKIPSSMMIQSWMGSDFSNDDLVKGTNLSRDYSHQILGEEKNATDSVVKVESIPNPNAPVIWGKLISWLRKSDQTLLKQEFYSEEMKLIKTLEGSQIVRIGNHTIPTSIKMKQHLKKSMTTVIYDPHSIRFDFEMADHFFTQKNLQKLNPNL